MQHATRFAPRTHPELFDANMRTLRKPVNLRDVRACQLFAVNMRWCFRSCAPRKARKAMTGRPSCDSKSPCTSRRRRPLHPAD